MKQSCQIALLALLALLAALALAAPSYASRLIDDAVLQRIKSSPPMPPNFPDAYEVGVSGVDALISRAWGGWAARVERPHRG